MPQPVPNLFTPSKAPRLKPAPPQNQQASAADGQSFRETLGRVKDRSARQPHDDDKQPAKTDHKKPAKLAKQTDQTKDAAEPKAKAPKPKDPKAGQDAQAQSDDPGHPPNEGGEKQPKQAPPDATPGDCGSPDAAQLAAIVQIQSPNAAQSETKAPPKATDETDSSSKPPVATGRVRPQPVKATSPKTNGGAGKTAESPDAPASGADGTMGQQPAADQPQADTTQPTETTQAQSKATKPPLLAAKQNSAAGKGHDADPAQQPTAMPGSLAPIDSGADDSGNVTQPALDEMTNVKSAAKGAAEPDESASQINSSDLSRVKVQGSAFKVAAVVDPAPPEAQFAEANHAKIVSGIHGQLLPGGGSMHIRLDPPELGAVNVRVEMRDGVMTAAFETTNDQATKLLSHSLGDLKAALEAQGVSVEKLHVRQSDRQQSSSGDGRQSDRQQDSAAQREQQRRDLMRRMWRRLMNGQDPLDLVA
jgi:flagellar hook-length control protein FliK